MLHTNSPSRESCDATLSRGTLTFLSFVSPTGAYNVWQDQHKNTLLSISCLAMPSCRREIPVYHCRWASSGTPDVKQRGRSE